MFSFILSFFGGWKNILIVAIVASIVGLLTLGYFRFENAIRENESLKMRAAQLEQNIKDKEQEIYVLNASKIIADSIISEQQKKLDEFDNTEAAKENESAKLPDANDLASPYYQDLFNRLGSEKK